VNQLINTLIYRLKKKTNQCAVLSTCFSATDSIVNFGGIVMNMLVIKDKCRAQFTDAFRVIYLKWDDFSSLSNSVVIT
jgi:hypothetical protein